MRPMDEGIFGALSNDSLQLILMPTEACNFRCVYCYEDFSHGRMEPQVITGVKNLIAARAPDLRSLVLSWFGGEPLLARDIIEEILSHARSLVAQHPAVRLSSDITTNAWLLTPAVFTRLLALGVLRYQISFDGPKEWHDRKRVLAGGGGTYDRIWGNLLAMRDAPGDFEITVRVHVDRENQEAIPRFIDEYEKCFGQDARFKLFMRPLSRLGGPNDRRLPILGQDEGVRVIDQLTRCADEKRLERSSAEKHASICYASQANSFLIRADGRINKCTVALNHPANQVGRILEDGRLEISSDRMVDWMRGLKSREPMELECPMIGLADPVSQLAVTTSG